MVEQKTLRVVAADDSVVMRGLLRTVFDRHDRDRASPLPRMHLLSVVRDGLEALAAVEQFRPDVLLLDLEMPRMGGLRVLDRLREQEPSLPVIMCSAHTERGADRTLEAMAHGARDYVMKPGQQSDLTGALDQLAAQLLPKIAALAGGLDAPRALPLRNEEAKPLPSGASEAATSREEATGVQVVVIGVSTGGPAALEVLLPMLPAALPVPVMIVQHMPKLFTGVLATRLNKLGPSAVAEAQDGERLRAGRILLAPGDAHMEVAQAVLGGQLLAQVKLHHGPPLNSCKPSVDYLFHSAARVFGSGVLAVVLTGMGSDGLEGAQSVRKAGGTVLAQDEATSAVWGMPGRVSREGIATQTLPLESLARSILQRVQSRRESFAPISHAAAQHGGSKSSREVRFGLF